MQFVASRGHNGPQGATSARRHRGHVSWSRRCHKDGRLCVRRRDDREQPASLTHPPSPPLTLPLSPYSVSLASLTLPRSPSLPSFHISRVPYPPSSFLLFLLPHSFTPVFPSSLSPHPPTLSSSFHLVPSSLTPSLTPF
ncbi:hypothetical protein E2C01_101918 [Portunus trituberculatus]|uniref:Uncharacterized protein n=1 Tax=Portunus trituberculatus TaxID=210409 RepID=A0A5B7KLD0_PORTR|nr:hypothetical protein [Portunus trituberculatus]